MDAELLLWTQVSAIGQVMGAVATAAAVIVSLWVVLSDRTPRIKASAGLRLVIGGDAPATDVMTFSLTNVGTRTAAIANVGWRTGWLAFGPKWMRYVHGVQMLGPPVTMLGSSVPPFDLPPGERKGIHVLCDRYEAHRRNEEIFTRKIPLFQQRQAANIYLWIEIIGARTRYVKVERSLEHFLATAKITKGAADFNAKAEEAG